MSALLTWLQGLFSQMVAALVSDWRAREAYRDQGEAAALEEARAREAKREEVSKDAEAQARDVFGHADDALVERVFRDKFGPGRK